MANTNNGEPRMCPNKVAVDSIQRIGEAGAMLAGGAYYVAGLPECDVDCSGPQEELRERSRLNPLRYILSKTFVAPHCPKAQIRNAESQVAE